MSTSLTVSGNPAPAEYVQPARDGLQWSELIRLWLRASWIILPVAVLGAVLAYAISYTMTPVYTANAVLLMDRASPGKLGNAADTTVPDSQQRANIVHSQVDILRGTDVVSRVIHELDLAANPMFHPKPGLLDVVKGRILSALGLTTHAAPSAGAAEDGLVAAYLSHLTVSQDADTYVLQVGFRAPDPALAARVANAEVANYIAWDREQKLRAIDGAQKWLVDAVAAARARVVAAEDAVQAFNRSGVLLYVDGQSALDHGLAQLTTDLAAAQARLVEANARADELRRLQRSGQTAGIAAISGSKVLQALQTQFAQARASSAATNTDYGANYPLARQENARNGVTQAEVNREIQSFVDGEASQATIARATVANLTSALDTMKQRVIAAESSRAKLQRLVGVANAERANYLTLLGKRLSYENLAGLVKADVTVLSPAMAPSLPQSPRRGLMAIFGFLLAGAVAAIAVAWRRGSGDAIRDSADLTSVTGIDCIAMMPEFARMRAGDPDTHNPDYSFFRQELRAVCARLMRDVDSRLTGGVSVMVTSPLPGEGKSTFCRELGRFAARSGVRTLIIHTDLTAGKKPPVSGVQQHEPALYSVDWVTPPSMLRAADAGRTIEAWCRDFGLVIFDTPPLSAMAESVILAPLVDATIVLARVDRTPRSLLASITGRIERAGGRIVGTVLSFVELDRQRGTVPSDSAYYFRQNRSYHRRLAAARTDRA